ncbi:hypothetical protein L21SP5_01721 [Salinivirga cyanobacteriivorans]|uniref:Uncharacterized protein n=1 Tax=Salinivirga cyanobacteriivorans TaxID=1307839 RepID=A0A0S2HZ38_9BACT|nr:hypothetical protein [Salinivirga cyanobacteriivorans]ALO15363.1 hypothetical protein L21SP5_01721 [Salinivirga cyanobacteriivorans]
MKKKNLLFVIGFLLSGTLALFSADQEDGNDNALIGNGNDVTCRCEWFGDDCSAGGWGFKCGADNDWRCFKYNESCT